MALAIRMSRGGRRNVPFYRIVVADSRFPRDGRYIERLGTYDPRLEQGNENRVKLAKERIEYWISQGAKPSRRVQIFMAQQGMGEMPEIRETPKKSAPKEKTVLRLEEKAKKKEAAAEAAKAAEEAKKEEAAAAKAAAEAAAAAPAPEAAPADAPAEAAAPAEAPAEAAAEAPKEG